jgi:hypothetical protein
VALVKPLHSGDPDVMSKSEQHLQPFSLEALQALPLQPCGLAALLGVVALLFGHPLSAMDPQLNKLASRLGGVSVVVQLRF